MIYKMVVREYIKRGNSKMSEESLQSPEKLKKKFEFPHVFVILFGLIIVKTTPAPTAIVAIKLCPQP